VSFDASQTARSNDAIRLHFTLQIDLIMQGYPQRSTVLYRKILRISEI